MLTSIDASSGEISIDETAITERCIAEPRIVARRRVRPLRVDCAGVLSGAGDVVAAAEQQTNARRSLKS